MTDVTVTRINERIQASVQIEGRLSSVFRIPTVVLWNRIEGRPRSDDLTRPLRAEVRDPAWMLARQWQFGEFEGADAGMPAQAKMLSGAVPLKQMRFREGDPMPYDPDTPIEFLVERQPVEPDMMMGLYLGRRWVRQLAAAFGAGDPIIASFRAVYLVGSPGPAAKDLESLKINSNRNERVLRRSLAGKSLNGAAVLRAIRKAVANGQAASAAFTADGVTLGDGREAAVDGLAADLVAWLDAMFGITGGSSWIPNRLEYEFSLAAPDADGTQARLISDQFPGGRVDWYSFDRTTAAAPAGGEAPPPNDPPRSVVPSRVNFFGAPSVRWWEFEDARVGFGLTTASKTDLAKVLLAEFGLVFSNDWFMLPYRASIGSLIDVKGIVVTDNFGFNTLVEPVAKRHRELGLAGNWSMWTLSRRDQPGQVDARLFLAPALEPSLESKPVDETLFLRDEMANLVWGVETVIPDPLGGGRDARLAGKQLFQAILAAFPPPPPENPDELADILVRYQLMGTVPENWIPFVAVKLQGQLAASNLLQGAMPRIPVIEPSTDGGGNPILENSVVLPRGTILARNPVESPNVVHEEDVLRDGVIVRRTFRQARWTRGGTFLWSALKKQTGRGEGSSGLAFDQAINKPARRQG
jgi:hypothetical protein